MPTQMSPLLQSLAYTYCPVCRDTVGNPKSQLSRDGAGKISCVLGHNVSWEMAQNMGADMIKFGEVFHEQPSINDVKWGIFVNPAVKAKLEAKFPQNLMVTIGTYLAALADGSVLLITGPQAIELRKLGINNGGDMVSAVKAGKESEARLKEAIGELERFQRLIVQAAAGNGGGE